MYPFSYTGLRIIHGEKVRDAMEQACIDTELTHSSQRPAWLSLLVRILRRIRSRLNVFVKPYTRTISSRPR